MTTRRQFLATSGSTLAATAVTSAQSNDSPLFSFGLMADCQYADVETAGSRFYRESPRKLREAVDELNRHDLAFSFHLGDFIDRNLESFDDLNPIAARLKSKLHHALGNHDFDVPDQDKAKVPLKLGLQSGYYLVRRSGFRLLVLDTTEVSTYRYPGNDPRTASAHTELKKLQAAGSPFAQSWNSRAGDRQMQWLKNELETADAAGETVLILGHHPVLPEEAHSTWNTRELRDLFARYPCAKAYLNGHNHAGAYHEAGGFHYLTLDGMLNTRDQNAFAVAKVHPDRLEISGFGRQESHTLKFR